MSRELDDFLRSYADLVLVNFWHEGCEASLYMEQLIRSIERFKDIPVLHLMLPEHREWAHAHGIYGTPALIAYYRHKPLFRLIGRVTPHELLQRFRDYDL